MNAVTCSVLSSPCSCANVSPKVLSHRQRSDWTLARIGSGNFGDVYRGLWQGTTKVALKKITNDDLAQEIYLNQGPNSTPLQKPQLVHGLQCMDDLLHANLFANI